MALNAISPEEIPAIDQACAVPFRGRLEQVVSDPVVFDLLEEADRRVRPA
ncbi:MAG: hypothetical protein QGG36_03145 [Pirellulaceae bacterium]|jgi:hypothetical protein|nr:hypothetical protein [Pirellulaceae bacterium]